MALSAQPITMNLPSQIWMDDQSEQRLDDWTSDVSVDNYFDDAMAGLWNLPVEWTDAGFSNWPLLALAEGSQSTEESDSPEGSGPSEELESSEPPEESGSTEEPEPCEKSHTEVDPTMSPKSPQPHMEPDKEANLWLSQGESNYTDIQVSYKKENTSQTDEAVAAPQTKRGKRKCPIPELHCAVRRPKLHRGKISVPEYITKETRLVDESQAKIDEIIKDITSDESPVLTIRKLKNLKLKLASFGDFNDKANQDWISR
ncbi:hypothetical protein V498_02394 [Pseudogymnoascus sp. VKM F-4517 (FW-2822)]|nr:hypothetical protein V498_02394 [Pseudogymnoascus sp. VKM F-4517 (FW-2822)]